MLIKEDGYVSSINGICYVEFPHVLELNYR